MLSHPLTYAFLLCCLTFQTGCTQGSYSPADTVYVASVQAGTSPPTNSLEQDILDHLTQLRSDQTAAFTNPAGWIAHASYSAASGHTCRKIHFITQHRDKVACFVANRWSFVPQVFARERIRK